MKDLLILFIQKCSIFDLSFSRIDILERLANYFHEDRILQNMLKLWLWFSEKVNLKEHPEPVHIKNSCKRAYSQNGNYENILNLFIQRKSHKYSILSFFWNRCFWKTYQSFFWGHKNMLNQFIQKIRHINAQFVIEVFLESTFYKDMPIFFMRTRYHKRY